MKHEIKHPDKQVSTGAYSAAIAMDHICQLAGNAQHCGIDTDLDGEFGREQSPQDLNTKGGPRAIQSVACRPRVQRGGHRRGDERKFSAVPAAGVKG